MLRSRRGFQGCGASDDAQFPVNRQPDDNGFGLVDGADDSGADNFNGVAVFDFLPYLHQAGLH